jgi:hypothetical protein
MAVSGGGAVAHAVFARALLEGLVLPGLAALQPYWVARPELITRPNSLADRKIGGLVGALAAEAVSSRARLEARLREQPDFLLREVKLWVVVPKRHLLERIWPLLLQNRT